MQTDRVPQAKHSLLASGLHEARVTPLICTLACLRTRAKQMNASSEWPPGGMRPTSLMSNALALAEAVTRLRDRPDPVPDKIPERGRRALQGHGTCGLIIAIATITVWNLKRHREATAGQACAEAGPGRRSSQSATAGARDGIQDSARPCHSAA